MSELHPLIKELDEYQAMLASIIEQVKKVKQEHANGSAPDVLARETVILDQMGKTFAAQRQGRFNDLKFEIEQIHQRNLKDADKRNRGTTQLLQS